MSVCTLDGVDTHGLLPPQVAVLERWFPDHRVVADHTWPGQTSVVLEVATADGDRVIAKASTGPAFDHHLDRELRAHRMLGDQLGRGFPQLLCADDDARVLVTRWLPGRLAEGSEWELDPAVHRAAGALLRRFQGAAPATEAPGHGADTIALGRLHLDQATSLISASLRVRAAERLDAAEPTPARLVPTHGDFQPRNWLVDPDRPTPDGTPEVSLIDFGRFDQRPWYSDLVRLRHGAQVRRPELRAALHEGLQLDGTRLDADESWHLEQLVQSLSTVVWATHVGELDFAEHGRSMLERTLDAWP